jgi:hypothetical protein
VQMMIGPNGPNVSKWRNSMTSMIWNMNRKNQIRILSSRSFLKTRKRKISMKGKLSQSRPMRRRNTPR